jgi:putative transposase
MVATLMCTIVAEPDGASAWGQHARVVDHLTERFPAPGELLAEAADNMLAYTAFPSSTESKIWSKSRQVRLNTNSRRADVVAIFPRTPPPR